MPDGSPRWRRPASAPGWFAAGVVVLLANTAYLAAFASPTPFYFGNVVLHMLLGLALAVACARPIIRAYRRAVDRRAARLGARRRRSR